MTTISNNPLPQNLLDSMNPAKADAKTTAAEAQDRFMTLLVTQMKNQDPLNPLDNAQVTSQLAQLSTVTGIDKLNGSLEALMGSYQASQSLQAAGMIGHSVLAPGNVMTLTDSGGYMGVELAEPVDSMKINVLDASGKVVDTISVGSHDSGVDVLHWDGKNAAGETMPDGQYKFAIEATRDGKDVPSITSLAFGNVGSVSTSTQGVKLNVSGLGDVNMADVRQIL